MQGSSTGVLFSQERSSVQFPHFFSSKANKHLQLNGSVTFNGSTIAWQYPFMHGSHEVQLQLPPGMAHVNLLAQGLSCVQLSAIGRLFSQPRSGRQTVVVGTGVVVATVVLVVVVVVVVVGGQRVKFTTAMQ